MVLSKVEKITETPQFTSMAKKKLYYYLNHNFEKLKFIVIIKNGNFSVAFPILILHCDSFFIHQTVF